MLHTPAGRRARRAGQRAYKALVPNRIAYDKRQKIEEAIEAHLAEADSLIRTLDMFDKDADLEGDRSDYEFNNGTGYSVGHRTAKHYWLDDLENDGSDAEASLGWPGGVDQVRAFRNHRISTEISGSDAEAEHDGREPEDFT